MIRTIGVLLGGEPGAGKTLTALSFSQDRTPTTRIVTDMESRVLAYLGEEDEPERLKYKFWCWPKPGTRFDTIELLEFYKGLTTGEVPAWKVDLETGETQRVTLKPGAWVVDNVVLFQRQLERVLASRENAVKIVQEMELPGFGMLLRFWKAPDPSWWNLVKSIIGELLLAARLSGISVLATTEAGNYWADYGKPKSATHPGQRILGRTAKALLTWRQLLDAVWMLDRTVPSGDGKTGLRELPVITMDLFNPKGSLVGVPPSFEWQGWSKFWERLGVRQVARDFTGLVQETREATPEELEEAKAAEEAVKKGAEESETLALERDAFLQSAVDELRYKSKKEVRLRLKELGFERFSQDRIPEMWAALSAREGIEPEEVSP